MSILIRVLLFFMIILSLASHSAKAGYVIFEKQACLELKNHKEEAGSPCLAPLAPSDPNQKKLYEILIKQTWPTSLGYPETVQEGLPEEVALQKALISEKLADHYQFFWIPDTLEDLHTAAFLVNNKNFVETRLNPINLSIYLQKNHESYETAGDPWDDPTQEIKSPFFYFNSVKALSAVSKLKMITQEGDLAHRQKLARQEINKYFNQVNELGAEAFLASNRALAAFLLGEGHQLLGKIQVGSESLEALFHNRESLRKLRSKIASYYDAEYHKSLTMTQHGSEKIDVQKEELDPSAQTLLDHVISLEIDSHIHNDALIFRGTNGVPGGALDSSFFVGKHDDHRQRYPYSSLSYGSTLYAGLFLDSASLVKKSHKSACALNYFIGGRYGYALQVNKNDYSQNKDHLQSQFVIPPLGVIGRLFGVGEYFHPRSGVGIKNISDLSQTLEGIEGRATLKFLNDLGYLTDDQENPKELAQKIAQYIADHAIIITIDGKVVQRGSKEEQEVIHHQKDLSLNLN